MKWWTQSKYEVRFFGEYSWSPTFKLEYGRKQYREKLPYGCPVQIRIAVFEISSNHGEFGGLRVLEAPHFDLIEKFKLRWEGHNAEFVNTKEELVAFDPTAGRKKLKSLLFREDLMRRYLKENELALCWFISGAKEIPTRKFPVTTLHTGGLYVLEDQGLRGTLWFYDPPEEHFDD